MKRRALFVDRDGIVNRAPGPGFVERWEDFHLLPEFVEVMRTARELGFETVVVTNQRGVAIGAMTQATLDQMHRNLRMTLLNTYGLSLLDVMVCTHDRDAGCACRKPKPGMLLAAAQRHDLDLAASWMVGDQATDITAGAAAGCRTVFVGADASVWADERVEDMKALVGRLREILSLERRETRP